MGATSITRIKIVSGQSLLRWLALLVFAMLPVYLFWWISNLDNTGTFYVSASFADINADGRTDIVAQNMRQESASTAFGGPMIWLNHGNHKFSPLQYELAVGESGGWSSALANIDQDGDPDLFRYQGYGLAIDLNQGGVQGGTPGVFRHSFSIADSRYDSQFGSVITGDLNGDGWADALVTGRTQMVRAATPGHSWVWLNSPNQPARYQSGLLEIPGLLGVPVGQAALADLDGDGDVDLLAAVLDTSGSRVLLNDGAGNFADSGQRLGSTPSRAVALADLDGDGDTDALLGTDQGAQVWINQGAGTFLQSSQRFERKGIRQVFLADFGLDGDPDALIVGATSAALYWNDGQGQFSRSGPRFRAGSRQGVSVGDVDGDGLPDIWIGRYDKAIDIFYNRGNGKFTK